MNFIKIAYQITWSDQEPRKKISWCCCIAFSYYLLCLHTPSLGYCTAFCKISSVNPLKHIWPFAFHALLNDDPALWQFALKQRIYLLVRQRGGSPCYPTILCLWYFLSGRVFAKAHDKPCRLWLQCATLCKNPYNILFIKNKLNNRLPYAIYLYVIFCWHFNF